MLALSLLSCGGGKKQPEGPVTLTLYHWMEKDRTLWEEEIIKPFEESHPGIRVILQTSPYPLYVTKSLTSIASGSRLADLMFAEDWFGQELIHKQYALNLDAVCAPGHRRRGFPQRDLHGMAGVGTTGG